MTPKKWITLFIATLAFLFSAAHAYAGQDAKPKDVILETTMGNIRIELYDDKAPASCKNFRQYVQDGFYNGLIFHRVIPNFVVQAGGFEPGMRKRTTREPIKNEADNGLQNRRGTLSMARTQALHSATSQFYINLKYNRNLDHYGNDPGRFGYAVFGNVVEGMEVVDKIAGVKTTFKGYYQDVPAQDVVIIRAYEVK